MKKNLFFLAIILTLGFLTSCEKENIEQTSVSLDTSALEAQIATLQSTVDNNQTISTAQWNATMAALGQIGQQVALLVANGNAIQADLQTLIGLVNTLTTLTQGNSVLLGQMWATIQSMNLDLATMQALLQSYGQTLLAMQQQLIAIQGDVSGINAQLALIFNQLTTLGTQNGQILQTVQGNSLFLQQLITAVGGVNNMLQLVLQNQAVHGATLAVIAATQVNQGQAIADVLTAVNAGNLTSAQVFVLVQQFIPALNALGVNIQGYVNQILAGINQLNLNDQQTAIALVTLIANSNAQAATSQTILNNLITQGLTQAQMVGTLNGVVNQLNLLQGSVDAWGALIISKIDQLQLTIQQQGIVLANIQANTANLPAFTAQVIAKLDALQLSVNDLKALQLAMLDHLVDIKASIADLQATTNHLVTQVTVLQNGQLDILVAIANKLCCCPTPTQPAPSIIQSFNYVYNEYLYNDNSINVNVTTQQIYNACANGLAVCPSGPGSPNVCPGINSQPDVCMVVNNIIPVISNNSGNVGFNWGQLGGTANNLQSNWGCQ